MKKMRERTKGTTKCVLCRNITTRYLTGGDYYHYNCSTCGPFWITGSAKAVLEQRPPWSPLLRRSLLNRATIEDGYPWVDTRLIEKLEAAVRLAKKEALREPAIKERLYYVRKALNLSRSEVLDGMAMMKLDDPDLDWEYALYHFVFDQKRVPVNEGFYLLNCKDGIKRIKLVVARKGAFSPNPEHRDPKYDTSSLPDLRFREGYPSKALLPKAYAPA